MLPAFEQPVREVRARSELGDGHVQGADSGVQVPVAVPVPLSSARGAGLAPFGTDHRVGIRGQQGVDHGLQQMAHHVRGRFRQGFSEQAGRVENMRSGHRDDSIRGFCGRLTRRITRWPRPRLRRHARPPGTTPLCGTQLGSSKAPPPQPTDAARIHPDTDTASARLARHHPSDSLAPRHPHSCWHTHRERRPQRHPHGRDRISTPCAAADGGYSRHGLPVGVRARSSPRGSQLRGCADPRAPDERVGHLAGRLRNTPPCTDLTTLT